MKKLWIVLVLLLLIGCGSKDLCPSCSAEVDFSKDVFCSNCGRTFTNVKPDGYEEPQEPQKKTHLGTWVLRIPSDEFSGDFYDVVTSVLLTLHADGSYDWEFGALEMNKDSEGYKQIIAEFGSEKAAEDEARKECQELAEELSSVKYRLVQSKNDLQEEFEDCYYDQASDTLWFTFDAGYVLSGTRK